MTKEAKIHCGEKTFSSTSGAGNTGQATCNTMKLEHSLIPHTKINLKGFKDLCKTWHHKTPSPFVSLSLTQLVMFFSRFADLTITSAIVASTLKSKTTLVANQILSLTFVIYRQRKRTQVGNIILPLYKNVALACVYLASHISYLSFYPHTAVKPGNRGKADNFKLNSYLSD